MKAPNVWTCLPNPDRIAWGGAHSGGFPSSWVLVLAGQHGFSPQPCYLSVMGGGREKMESPAMCPTPAALAGFEGGRSMWQGPPLSPLPHPPPLLTAGVGREWKENPCWARQ